MRLSEWRAKPPVRDALGTKTMAVVSPVLGVMGVEVDPHAWVLWGDDPDTRYTIFVPISAGLVVVGVRNLGAAGYRAAGKIVRWSRVQLGELAVETEGPHRMISFQLEATVLRGADEVADAVGRFALVVFAAAEGRPWPPFDAAGRRRPAGRATTKAAGAKGSSRASAAKVGAGPGRAAGKPDPRLLSLPARAGTDRRASTTTDRRGPQA